MSLLVEDCSSCVEEPELEPEPELTVCPFELTTATFAKSVFSPKAALNASACAPVPAGAWLAAFVAVEHSEVAALFALQLVWSCWQMKLVSVPMSSVDPWLNDSYKF